MRVDPLSWARAVHSGTLKFEFRGIQRWHDQAQRNPFNKWPAVVRMLISDEQYMDGLRQAEVDYKVKSGEWDEDWETFCRNEVHDHLCCPNGSDEEKAQYERRFEKLFRDPNAKEKWADDGVDFDDLADQVKNDFDAPESIMYFLKEYPIESVAGPFGMWRDIDDVVGFCPDCDEPLTKEHVGRVDTLEKGNDTVQRHRFGSARCDCGDHQHLNCLFDRSRNFREVFKCCHCGKIDALDSLEGTFEERWQKPFHWPPGAMYPPNRGFAGQHLALPEERPAEE